MFNLFKKSDMKLIVGLGNPGKQYENTRHNVGFMALDFLYSSLCHPESTAPLSSRTKRSEDPGSHDCTTGFKLNKKFKAEVSEVKEDDKKIILAKPMTFMNNSGEAVSKIAKFYKIKPENITIVHDDLDLDFGKIKNSVNRGSAGHNGVKSIINFLKTQDFARIRIGVGKSDKIPSDKYVMMPFSKTEMDKLNNIFEEIKI